MDHQSTTKDQIRSLNWNGSIPVVLTLAPSSLGTTTMPHPIHAMIHRGSFLHVELKSAIQRLHKFAPATITITTTTTSSSSSSNRRTTTTSRTSTGSFGRDNTTRVSSRNNEPDDNMSRNSNDNNNNNTDKNNNDDDTNVDCSRRSSSTQHQQQQQKDDNIMNDNDNQNADEWNFPVCWIEDEEAQLPLRWHLFAGVLYDMMKRSSSSTSSSSSTNESTQNIPWKLRLHFSQYPTSQLLPLEENHVWTSIQRSFKNSLKQALFMEHNQSRVAMNLSKQMHSQLWDALVNSNYALYQQINVDYLSNHFNGGNKKNNNNNNNNSSSAIHSDNNNDNNNHKNKSSSLSTVSSLHLIPIRVFVDSKPPLQRPCPANNNNNNNKDGDIATTTTKTTLGMLLLEWLPDLFHKQQQQEQQQQQQQQSSYHDDDTDDNDDDNGSKKEMKHDDNDNVVIVPRSPFTCRWWVAGIVPPLSVPVEDLWQTLCHPDHFLYIIVRTR